MSDDRRYSFDHVALTVPDLQIAEAFYVGVLGLREVKRKTWINDDRMDSILGFHGSSGSQLLLTDGSFDLEIWCFDQKSPTELDESRPVTTYGFSHVALIVEDIHSLHGHMVLHGTTFHTPPSTGPTGTIATYGRDPFGNVIELVQRPTA